MSNDSAGSWQERVNQVVSARGPRARARLLTAPTGARAADERTFSPFVDGDLDRATALAAEMMAAAERGGGPPDPAAAMDLMESRLGTEVPGLVQYALALFLTHYPPARAELTLPALEERQPELVLPSSPGFARGADAAPAKAGASPPEDELEFWREDPLLNEHHEHWHLVYPMRGRPSPDGPPDIGDRHGELFAYMHEQMLARYDAERLGVGLPRVA
ncbi:MAG: hypothetical protein QOD63_2699, partial [Actinomycetota bacterium]|nr:hypothetical protein [Actinomycetota bacterium]